MKLPPETGRADAAEQLRGLPAGIEGMRICFRVWIVVSGLSAWFCFWLVRALTRTAEKI